MKILKVNLNDVLFSEVALRSHKETDEHIRELADDINNRGLLNLPTLVPSQDEEGKYHVTDGARRVTALKLLLKEGKVPEELSFQVTEPQDELETLGDMISGNANVLKTTNKQFIEAMYRIATETDTTMPELAKKVGKSEEYIWKLFKTLKLGDELLEEAQASGVSISNLITLSELKGKVDDDDMKEWVEKAKTTTVAEFSDEVAEELDAIKEALKGQKKEVEFKLTNKFIGKDALELLLVSAETAFTTEATPATEARYNLMREIFQVDEKSAAARKKDWEDKQEKKKQKAAERKKARDDAKLIESIGELDKQGFQVTKDGKPVDIEAEKAKLEAEKAPVNE